MSAAARAEARRKAILSRGTDRLAKLTTSGRGGDDPVYVRGCESLAQLISKFPWLDAVFTPSPNSKRCMLHTRFFPIQ
jgi:hypothetical protein